MLLAADIGGTKAELAVFPFAGGAVPLFQQRYNCNDFRNPDDLLARFFTDSPYDISRACIAAAGPVQDNRLTMTNLGWLLDGEQLAVRFSLHQVLVINDLTALAMAIPVLPSEELLTIKPGKSHGEVLGIIAPGTGLGEAMLFSGTNRQLARGTEGGHCNFAPVNAEQRALLNWLIGRVGEQPVNYEHLISGPGIGCLFDFCREYYQQEPLARVALELHAAKDRTVVIVNGFLREPQCPLCCRAITLFLDILGSEAGNLALKLLATGGIYIGGGIVPRLLPRADFTRFCDAFSAKAKMTGLLEDIAVSLVLHNDAPLIGAAAYGRQMLGLVDGNDQP